MPAADVPGLFGDGDVRLVPPEQVVGQGAGNQGEQHQQELALLDEVGLAGLEDDVSHVEHRIVGRVFCGSPPAGRG